MNSQRSQSDFPRNALPYILAFLLIMGIIVVLILAHGGQSFSGPSG